jgi:hypothetical protein
MRKRYTHFGPLVLCDTSSWNVCTGSDSAPHSGKRLGAPSMYVELIMSKPILATKLCVPQTAATGKAMRTTHLIPSERIASTT